MPKKTGRITVSINNRALESKKGAELDLGGRRRTPMNSDQGTIFFTEEIVHSMVKFTLIHTSESELRALSDVVDETITFICDTGTVYSIANAFCTGPPKLKDGEATFEFAGRPAEEIR